MKIFICDMESFLDKQGIHLRDADSYYLNDAMNTAERDGFESIYLHTSRSGLMYKLSQDVLLDLFRLNLESDIEVIPLHPAETENTFKRKLKQAN